MADVIQLLHELRDMFEAENVPIVVQKIDEALKQPQMKIETPKGDLVVEIAQNETLQASVCLENETLGPVDLFMAEVLTKEISGDLYELYHEKDGYEEGDIRMISWEDPATEDYTRLCTITAQEIEQLEEDQREP
ncbi:MAG: hypothetical protein IKM88_14070 [Lachnospiraceae bacterium]|nr:hypothetical protein [Lachnospiraceae bacterium]MBR6851349.1 hypothetical protein [Lachnospiraceae bacterium]